MSATALLYNPFLPEFRRDPYPIYAALRDREPVHRFATFRGEQWLLTRYDHVRELLADPRFLVDDLPDQMQGKTALAPVGSFDRLIAGIRHWLFFHDAPTHAPVRRLFSRELSSAGVARHRPLIETLAGELFRQALAKPVFDLIADVAYLLPAQVMARLLGVPHDRLDQVMQWSTALFRVMVPPQSIDSYCRMDRMLASFVEWFRPHVQAARNAPGENLLGLLLRAERDGVLDEAGVFALAIMLMSVGQETTESLIGNGMLGLLAHPEQARMLADDPDRAPEAVNEMLRYDTPVQGVARITAEPVQVGETLLPARARVNFALGAANRDPAHFVDPDRFVMDRSERSLLPFGAGIHFCLGAHLARLQAECVVRLLFRHAPDCRLATGQVEWRESVLLRGVKALPLQRVASPAVRQAIA